MKKPLPSSPRFQQIAALIQAVALVISLVLGWALVASAQGVPGTICHRECSRGILRITFSARSRAGKVFCPSTPTLVLHCDPYSCESATDSCVEVCNSDSDCLQPYVCDLAHLPTLGQCVPLVYTCDGDNTLRSLNGQSIDCTPYKCSGHQCLDKCKSILQCAPPYVCVESNVCVPL